MKYKEKIIIELFVKRVDECGDRSTDFQAWENIKLIMIVTLN